MCVCVCECVVGPVYGGTGRALSWSLCSAGFTAALL